MESLAYYYLFDCLLCMNVWVISCYCIVMVVCICEYMHGEELKEKLERNTEWREYVNWESEIHLHRIL